MAPSHHFACGPRTPHAVIGDDSMRFRFSFRFTKGTAQVFYDGSDQRQQNRTRFRRDIMAAKLLRPR
jgi:hypothetical protein